jgi:hypothetical protein
LVTITVFVALTSKVAVTFLVAEEGKGIHGDLYKYNHFWSFTEASFLDSQFYTLLN